MPDIFIPIADGDGNNSDGILKEIIISLTGESFIKLFDTKYTNLNTIEKNLMHIAFRLILSRNFFISKDQLTQYEKIGREHSSLDLYNPTIYSPDELTDKITALIMKHSTPYINIIKLVRNFLTVFKKDHMLLTDTYKINVLEKDQLLFLTIQKELTLKYLKDKTTAIADTCIYKPRQYVMGIAKDINQNITDLAKDTINALDYATKCVTIPDIIGSLGTLVGGGKGGGTVTTDAEEKEYRKKLIQIIEDVLNLMDKNTLGYKTCNSFLEFIKQESDDIIIIEKISSRLLGFIFSYCEFIHTVDENGTLDVNMAHTKPLDSYKDAYAVDTAADKKEKQKATDASERERKALDERVLREKIEDELRGKMETEGLISERMERNGGKKTKHKRRNKRKTLKRKIKMK